MSDAELESKVLSRIKELEARLIQFGSKKQRLAESLAELEEEMLDTEDDIAMLRSLLSDTPSSAPSEEAKKDPPRLEMVRKALSEQGALGPTKIVEWINSTYGQDKASYGHVVDVLRKNPSIFRNVSRGVWQLIQESKVGGQ